MIFDNLAKTDNFFPAFLLKEAIYSSKQKVLSISKPKSFCFLLSQNFCFSNICPNIFVLKSRNK